MTATSFVESVSENLTARRGDLAPWLLAVFLGLSPAVWLPGVPQGLVRFVEWLVILTALAVVFASEFLAGRRLFPPGLLGPWGVVGLLVFWIPGLVRAASFADAADFFVEIGSGFAFAWCFFCLARESRGGSIVWAVLRRSFAIFSLLAGVALLNEIPVLALWETESRFVGSGFGGFEIYSPIWAMALALFLPVAALAFRAQRGRRRVVWRFCCVLAVVVLLTSLLLTNSLTGMLASFVVIVGLALLSSTRRLGLIVIAVIVVAVAPVCLDVSCGTYLNDGAGSAWDSPVQIACSIDQTANRRLAGIVQGVSEIAESPVFGHGLGHTVVFNFRGEAVEIHNLWSNWAFFTGPLAPLFLMIVAGSFLRTGLRVGRQGLISDLDRRGAQMMMLVLVAGLVMSVSEPRAPFGNFHVAAIWWAAAGILAGLDARRRRGSEALDDHGHALAAADAHRLEPDGAA